MNETLNTAKELIVKKSITPEDAGCQDFMIQRLEKLGFEIERMPHGDVKNFYAKKGSSSPLIVFAVKKVDLTTNIINDWIKNISSPYTSENLINKTGMTWRKLSEDEKKLPLTKENIISLIKKYPTAMKRPLITNEGDVLAIGFDENIYEEKIK